MRYFIYCVLAVAIPVFIVVGITIALADESMPVTQNGFSSPSHGSSIVAIARRDIGHNPTGNRYLWCMDAVNRWIDKAGYQTTGSRAARSILNHGQSIRRADLRPGDIVFKPRRGGGHVEVFVRWADGGKTAYYAITGNSCGPRGRRVVCEVKRPAIRIRAAIRLTRST